MQALYTELLTLAKKKYAVYADDDPAYLTDLTRGAEAADRTWRAYRDAQCTVEPLFDGMSRKESGDLTEACRLAQTQTRIKELKNQLTRKKKV